MYLSKALLMKTNMLVKNQYIGKFETEVFIMLYETASFEKYPGLQEKVYAPKWYYSKEVKQDDYSTKIFYSKEEDKSWFFIRHLIDLISEMEKEREADFQDVELITIIPSHKPEVYSVTLERLAKFLSHLLKVKYEKILVRTKNTRPNGMRHKDATERYEHVKDSLSLTRELTEKKILLFDDVKTTGIEILEVKKVLINAGLENTITICLGINSSTVQDTESMIYTDEEGRKWRGNN